MASRNNEYWKYDSAEYVVVPAPGGGMLVMPVEQLDDYLHLGREHAPDAREIPRGMHLVFRDPRITHGV